MVIKKGLVLKLLVFHSTIQLNPELELKKMPKEKKTLLDFWEDQMRQSHTASNYFFRKSPSHYHMMLLVMSAHKENKKLSVEELKTKLFKTSRPKSALIITEACEKGFFLGLPFAGQAISDRAAPSPTVHAGTLGCPQGLALRFLGLPKFSDTFQPLFQAPSDLSR